MLAPVRFEIRVGFRRGHEGLLVLLTAARLSIIALTAQVGIVGLHEAVGMPGFSAIGHCLHDLALQAPSGAIRHAQMPLQLIILRLLRNALVLPC